MSFHFDLLTEPWIPVVDLEGKRQTLGIRDLLLHAHHLSEVSAETPPMTASILLLLLAIVYRVYSPQDEDAWYVIWKEEKFTEQTLDEYLEKWKSRFDLFDEKYPFFQDPKIGQRKTDLQKLGGKEIQPKSIKNLLLHVATGDNATLFDHSMEYETPFFTPAQAVRILLADMYFGLGGMGAASISADRFYKDSVHGRGMVFWVKEDNLFKSIMLNCPGQYFLPAELINQDDLPAWEAEDYWKNDRNLPNGFLDFLTWQSRRIKLIPNMINNEVVIQDMFYNPGLGLSEVFINPFYHYIHRDQKGEQIRILLKFKEERSLWRDSPSILDSKQGHQPVAVRWMHGFVANIEEINKICFQTFGACTEPGKKKVYFYGGEQFKYPASIIKNQSLIHQLQIGMNEAEEIGYALKTSLRKLAEIILAQQADFSESRKPDPADMDKLLDHWHAEGVYWGNLETHFQKFINQVVIDPEKARQEWQKTIKETAKSALSFAIRVAGDSPAALKAAAFAEKKLNYQLKQTLNPNQEEVNV